MLKLFQPGYCTPAIGLQAPFIRRPHVSSTGARKRIFDDNGQLIIRHDT